MSPVEGYSLEHVRFTVGRGAIRTRGVVAVRPWPGVVFEADAGRVSAATAVNAVAAIRRGRPLETSLPVSAGFLAVLDEQSGYFEAVTGGTWGSALAYRADC